MLQYTISTTARRLGVRPSCLRRLLGLPLDGSLDPAAISPARLRALALAAVAKTLRQQATSPEASFVPAHVGEQALTPVVEVGTHWGGGGVEHGDRASGLSPTRIEKPTPKSGYVVDIIEKKGKGARHQVRLRGWGEGIKGGRARKKEMHPVIEEMIDGLL